MSEAQRVRSYVEQRFPQVAARRMTDDDSLLESGVVDSLGILDLASFIESEFKVQLEDEEMSPENFDSIESITQFVSRKAASR